MLLPPEKPLRVLYLFNGSRAGQLEKLQSGEISGDGFWGMTRLAAHGISADYIEIEQFLPAKLCKFIRRLLPVYFIHIPVFWKIFSYDIVFTSSAFGSQFLHAILRMFGIKKPLWIMHDFSVTGLAGDGKKVKQRIFRWMACLADGIVVLGSEEKQRVENLFPVLMGKIELIPFGADITFFAPHGDVHSKRHLLSVGFDPDRDWSTLIEACEGMGVPLIIATRPSRVKHLQPLPNFVSIKTLSQRQLSREYNDTAIVIIPLDSSAGVNDAMGCSTLFEAMASGKAIIATRTHVFNSYITDGINGLLVPEGDVEALRQSIKRLLADTALCEMLGKNSRAYAVEHLDSARCAGQLANFFKKIWLENSPTRTFCISGRKSNCRS